MFYKTVHIMKTWWILKIAGFLVITLKNKQMNAIKSVYNLLIIRISFKKTTLLFTNEKCNGTCLILMLNLTKFCST